MTDKKQSAQNVVVHPPNITFISKKPIAQKQLLIPTNECQISSSSDVKSKQSAQTAEEWLQFNYWKFRDLVRVEPTNSKRCFILLRWANEALAMARAEEREKFNDWGNSDFIALQVEKAKREIAKAIFEELERENDGGCLMMGARDSIYWKHRARWMKK